MNEISEALPTKEKGSSRTVVVYFVRHGEATYKDRSDKDGSLTENGKFQAEKAAEKLFNQIQDGVVKFYSSPLRRSYETAQILREKIEQMIGEEDKDLRVLVGDLRERRGLTSIDLLTDDYWRLRREGISDPVQYWINHPAENPQESLVVFEKMINHFRQLSMRIPTDGPNIHLICVTHGGNPELFLKKTTGLQEIPNLNNCEIVKFDFSRDPNQKPRVSFRGDDYQI